MTDVLGNALNDYYHKTSTARLWVHHRIRGVSAYRDEPRERMPVDVYFRDMEQMPELEWVALQQCRGRILDIGAGAGSHALALQKMGQDITALDISPQAVGIMKARGVKKVVEGDFFQLAAPKASPRRPAPLKKFDTLLLLMNGIGISGTLDGLRRFFASARALLQPGGQLIFDSSDVAYLYDGKPPRTEGYYGEIFHQYEYRRERSDWFGWLFIDYKTLKKIAGQEGWSVSLLYEDPWEQYLVRCGPQ
ncbi:MAG: class I SAM-dependent methyltransferase [Bacteroidetes bacterium]|nr:class I SAM-dependent methyltransferase [Bacteroidota bacterium]